MSPIWPFNGDNVDISRFLNEIQPSEDQPDIDMSAYDSILAGYVLKHQADIDAYQARLEARILELEHQLAQPKHQRWQAPIRKET